MTEDTNGNIKLVGLTKRFGLHTAVAGIDLDIPAGEFFSLLGPSGCGKTTTLRMIAGFERPDEGRILLNGEDMAQSPPNKRPVNTVFQSYALFPHLNVFDNVAFGLRRRRLSNEEVNRRAGEALELVMLDGLETRKPSELSGGQQQRVALARALVLQPAGLLLDEPLGALDAKLRRQLQIELKSLQQRVGITFVYVTHDQDEALTMSDRIAVMNEGRVEQAGSPRQIYEAPETAFVADFLGASNLMDATARGDDGRGRCRVEIGGRELVAALGDSAMTGQCKATIRPERVHLELPGPAADAENRVKGKVERSIYIGSAFQLIVSLDIGCTIEVEIQNTGYQTDFPEGGEVSVHLPAESLRVLRPGSSSGDRGQSTNEVASPGDRTGTPRAGAL
jgi:spermidine/putrescine transport system ATP-binding protein